MAKTKNKNPDRRSYNRKVKRAVKTGNRTGRGYAKARHYQARSESRRAKRYATNPTKYKNPKRAPKGWIRADRVRVVKKGGRRILEVYRKPKRRRR